MLLKRGTDLSLSILIKVNKILCLDNFKVQVYLKVTINYIHAQKGILLSLNWNILKWKLPQLVFLSGDIIILTIRFGGGDFFMMGGIISAVYQYHITWFSQSRHLPCYWEGMGTNETTKQNSSRVKVFYSLVTAKFIMNFAQFVVQESSS